MAPALATIAGILFLFIGLQLWYRARPQIFETVWFWLLSWLGAWVMGVTFCFLMFSLVGDGLRLILLAIGQWIELAPQIDRFLASSEIFLGAALLVNIWGFWTMHRGPHVKEIAVPVDGLPTALEGLRIVQISDLHVGVTIRSRYVQRVVDKINALGAGFVVVTGDLVDARAQSVAPHLEPLKSLRSEHGTYYVLGNHEHYWGVEPILEQISKIGFKSLLNTNEVISIQGHSVMVAGVTDPTGGHRPDLLRATASKIAADFKVLLSHRPGFFSHAAELGYHLQLSGHTHAGQFFPFSIFIPLAHRYYRGLNRHGSLWVYVNSGTGYWGPANRFAVAAEITVLNLKINPVAR